MEQTQQNSRWISAIEFFHLKKSGGSDVSFLRTAAKWPGPASHPQGPPGNLLYGITSPFDHTPPVTGNLHPAFSGKSIVFLV